MSCCFAAASASGRLLLALPDPPGDAVDAALALAAHEPLLAALEAWLQQPLDPEPVPAFETDAALLWADAAGVRLGLPWPLLAATPAAPAWAIDWPTLDFEIDVAGFDTAPLPAAAQGGALLLPAAFEAAWRVSLHAGVPPLVAEAEWRGPGAALSLCGPPEPATTARPAWRVRLAENYRRPVPELLGWVPAGAALAPAGAAWLVGPDGVQRAGRIAPALGGAGLWFDERAQRVAGGAGSAG